MKIQVVIDLEVPKNLKNQEYFSAPACLISYIRHWLEEGYYVENGNVELPHNIKYKGFDIKMSKELELWAEKKRKNFQEKEGG